MKRISQHCKFLHPTDGLYQRSLSQRCHLVSNSGNRFHQMTERRILRLQWCRWWEGYRSRNHSRMSQNDRVHPFQGTHPMSSLGKYQMMSGTSPLGTDSMRRSCLTHLQRIQSPAKKAIRVTRETWNLRRVRGSPWLVGGILACVGLGGPWCQRLPRIPGSQGDLICGEPARSYSCIVCYTPGKQDQVHPHDF